MQGGFRFKPASGPVWRAAFEGQISEQAIFDQIAANFYNIVRSVVSWLAIEIVVHRGENFFQKSKNEQSKKP